MPAATTTFSESTARIDRDADGRVGQRQRLGAQARAFGAEQQHDPAYASEPGSELVDR